MHGRLARPIQKPEERFIMSYQTILSRTAFVILAAAVFLTAAPAFAQVDVAYTWSAPTTGSPVVHYVVQHSVDGGAWIDMGTVVSNAYTLSADFEVAHSIRVAAVDGQGRQGVWSEPSDPFTPDAGVPGQPGKPIVF
jgi:hypothetical protein